MMSLPGPPTRAGIFDNPGCYCMVLGHRTACIWNFHVEGSL